MFRETSSAREQLKELEAVLGFDYDDQDWGIVNADPSRTSEFARFFEERYNEHWSPGTVAEFVDLVLESASSAVRADPNFPIGCIDRFVTLAAPLAPQAIEYWTSRDWAVTPHLRALGY
jgi:hypothetical protein